MISNFCLLLITLLMLCSGCGFFGLSSKDNRKKIDFLVDPASVATERTSGRTEIIVRFSSKRPAMCRLRYWEQKKGATIPPDALITDCSSRTYKVLFDEVLRSIAPKELYYIAIESWENAAPDKVKIITVAEPATANLKNDLFVVRANLPLRAAQVHRYRAKTPITEAGVAEMIPNNAGCEPIEGEKPTYQNADLNMRISKVVTSGFAAAKVSAEKKSRLTFGLGTFDEKNSWAWSTFIDGFPELVSIKNVPIISSVTVLSEESASIYATPQLGVIGSRAMTVNPAVDLTVNLRVEAPVKSMTLFAQIGLEGRKGSVRCYGQSDSGSGSISIPSDVLKNFEKKPSDLVIGLIGNQFATADGAMNSRWLFQTHDFKMIRMEIR